MKELLDLADTWDRTSGARLTRANQLGPCRAGEVMATEASILRECAGQLRDAVIHVLGTDDESED